MHRQATGTLREAGEFSLKNLKFSRNDQFHEGKNIPYPLFDALRKFKSHPIRNMNCYCFMDWKISLENINNLFKIQTIKELELDLTKLSEDQTVELLIELDRHNINKWYISINFENWPLKESTQTQKLDAVFSKVDLLGIKTYYTSASYDYVDYEVEPYKNSTRTFAEFKDLIPKEQKSIRY